ncbi:2-dehydro-3-deoxy-6-phosphogalactonate aldolase [Pseudoxanthomonas japonensis]|jgi:2-dehydro-3-deoxyphosphogalactonate aldolase|uniref:2-dehydro-3-deoxy-6-phosphogalactonate aldolase n=1 Tax=Pseudoxanthomonas japonensis TaxID=69284 RepID=UPI001BCAEEF1|nr:2-dehydro-3-deoxy-6-phosphogalactonate aldolase [Pseudoxanthomonas japonensis]MCR6626143.1 2-dehydro-3-deoxy-6-phosphogalactonate aldolase [Pseudoxanthomonas sp.]
MHAPTLPFALPLIAILRGITPDETHAHVGALVDEGYDAIEIPANSPAWQRSVRIAADAFGDRALIGAGTVLTTGDVDALVAAGGRLMVTPNTRPPVIRHAVDRGLQVAAGVATASEAFDALEAGAQMLKLFPASVYGPAMVRALRSVLPPAPLFAVGGVTPDTLSGYLSAGCQGAGIGGELYTPGQAVERTREHARRFRQAYLDHAA